MKFKAIKHLAIACPTLLACSLSFAAGDISTQSHTPDTWLPSSNSTSFISYEEIQKAAAKLGNKSPIEVGLFQGNTGNTTLENYIVKANTTGPLEKQKEAEILIFASPGTLLLNDARRNVKPNDIVYIKAQTPHQLIAGHQDLIGLRIIMLGEKTSPTLAAAVKANEKAAP